MTDQEGFAATLERVLSRQPYAIFLFVSGACLFASIIANRFFNQVAIFFLYAVAGTIWRYAERDFIKRIIDNGTPKGKKQGKIIRAIYHLGNAALLIVLFYFLKKLY